MRDWNVVATVRDGQYRHARDVLRSACGAAERTEFYNVLVAKTDDLTGLMERIAGDERARSLFSRVVPLTSTFVFQRPQELDEAAALAAAELAPALAGRSFHVRFHRRGFKGSVRSIDEERRLSEVLLRATSELGEPARLSFEAPDAIVVVETVGNRGGISLWTREQLERWPLLHLD
ncbi:MAG: THUMP domain-containing protein [Sandaracinaceae bacterium]|nr:THUMP domain-containing protein [Sandaracinaceae bacterium]